jgi:hypothetical protein
MGRKEMYESVLKKFSTVITESDGCYIVTYGHGLFEGTCKYVGKSGMSRLQPQSVLLLTETDMGDVIEYIHKEYPLSSDDHNDLQMYIREHSLRVIREHVRGMI